LYRCGRRADALAVYRHGRQVLAQELGVEPGSAISELHRRMRSGDPGLDAAVQPPPVGVGVPTPAQLPADIPDFTGRARARLNLT
jgi:hypothetical protein